MCVSLGQISESMGSARHAGESSSSRSPSTAYCLKISDSSVGVREAWTVVKEQAMVASIIMEMLDDVFMVN